MESRSFALALFDATQAVGNTTNKWANKELGIRAAREEQEFVEKLQASPCRLLHTYPSGEGSIDTSKQICTANRIQRGSSFLGSVVKRQHPIASC